MPQHPQPPDRSPAALDLGRVAALAIGALLAWTLRGILLLGFTSVLIAVTLRAIADPLARRTKAPPWLALTVVIVLTLLFIGGAAALFGWRIADQYDAILAKARTGMADIMALVNSHALGRNVLHWMQGAKIDGATAMLTPAIGSVLGSVGSGVAYTAIVIASGIFLTIDPARHLRGVLLVVPEAGKPMVEAFLARSANVLRKWLVSRLIVMVAIGVLSSLGLWALGIDGTFITPYAQDAEVDLPPVLTMYSTVVFTVLFGASGIFLASPLALMVIVAIQVFYLKSPPTAPKPPKSRQE